jgi:hypothetical protein
MGSLPRTVLRLALASLLVLGCACGARGPAHGAAAGALPAAWVAPTCLVADTSAPTADTLYVIGVLQNVTGPGQASVACAGHRGRSGAAPVIVPLEAPAGIDLRDVLELGVADGGGRRPDVLVTRDPDVIAYARGRPDLFVEALPWSVTYVLVPAHHDPVHNDSTATIPALPSSAARDAMARDAVAADARGAAEPFAWRNDAHCALSTGSVPTADAHPVVAYAEADATARQLAERIVSLAATDARQAWLSAAIKGHEQPIILRVAPMPADSAPAALATGRAVAGVLAIARDPQQRCGTSDGARVPARAVPLVDTRAHVIVRRGSGATFLVAPDGSFHFVRRAPR